MKKKKKKVAIYKLEVNKVADIVFSNNQKCQRPLSFDQNSLKDATSRVKQIIQHSLKPQICGKQFEVLLNKTRTPVNSPLE